MAAKCHMTLDSQELWFCESIIKEWQGEELSSLISLLLGRPQGVGLQDLEIHNEYGIAGISPSVNVNNTWKTGLLLGPGEVSKFRSAWS